MSETGFEQAVAAPKVLARSSIKFQFSGPFIPLPAETTISASAMDIFPETFSEDSTEREESATETRKSSSVSEVLFS